jgi:uncharacterized repeat protein (TIGR04002 family)
MTALLTALIMLLTAYVLHIPIGVNNGYVHLGDTMIYLSAVLLPTPFALLSAAVGGALADVLSGAALWAIPTAVIKALMVLPFTASREKLFCRRNAFAPVISGMIGVVGYFIAEVIIVSLAGGVFEAAVGGAVAAILPNVLQEIAGGIAFCLLATALDRVNFKNRIRQML